MRYPLKEEPGKAERVNERTRHEQEHISNLCLGQDLEMSLEEFRFLPWHTEI